MPTKQEKIRQLQNRAFTGRTSELRLFRSLLPTTSRLEIDILVIHGIGGIGKSRLLDQLQQQCVELNIPQTRVEPQVHTSVYDMLSAMREQLASALEFKHYDEAVRQHQQIERKLVGDKNLSPKILKLFVRGSRAAIGSLIPVIGSTINEMISAEEMEANLGKIYTTVGKHDAEFWMKPDSVLTEAFIADTNAYCDESRLVFLVDSYEKIGNLDSWIRDQLLANLADYALFVIAGRRRLEGQGWEQYAQLTKQIELSVFNESESLAYLQSRDITDGRLLSEIVEYTDGYPLMLCLLADLSPQLRPGDLSHAPERRKMLRNVLERIVVNTSERLRQVLEIGGILRVVNQDILGFMLDQMDCKDLFDEFTKFDFVKIRNGGVALHDAVWDAMNEELRWRSPQKYKMLNAKAAEWYGSSQSRTRKAYDYYLNELVFHQFSADEQQGLAEFKRVAETLVQSKQLDKLANLLADIERYQIEETNTKMWLKYYKAAFQLWNNQYEDAAFSFREISTDRLAEDQLRAYALCDLGYLMRRLHKPEATDVLQQGLDLARIDQKTAFGYMYIASALGQRGDLSSASEYYARALDYYTQNGDDFGVTRALIWQRHHFLTTGDLRRALEIQRRVKDEFSSVLDNYPFAHLEYVVASAAMWVWYGRLHQAELGLMKGLEIADALGYDIDEGGLSHQIAFVVGCEGKQNNVQEYFDRSLKGYEKLGKEAAEVRISTDRHYQARVAFIWGDLATASARIEAAIESYRNQYDGKRHDPIHLPYHFEVFTTAGQIYEAIGDSNNEDRQTRDIAYSRAELLYKECDHTLNRLSHPFFSENAIVAIARIKYKQREFIECSKLLKRASIPSNQSEHFEVLAHFLLLWGHLLWDTERITEQEHLSKVVNFYKRTMIYALRFNRFLLDEILGITEYRYRLAVGIVQVCRQHGSYGLQVIRALGEWWATGVNTLDDLENDPILSPIPVGIKLIEAEELARRIEPGYELRQQTVIDQLLQAQSMF